MPKITSEDIKTIRVMRFSIPRDDSILDKINSDLTKAEMPYLFVCKNDKCIVYVHKGEHSWKDVLQTVRKTGMFKYRYTLSFYHLTDDNRIKLIY